jgi:hypothetical protein
VCTIFIFIFFFYFFFYPTAYEILRRRVPAYEGKYLHSIEKFAESVLAGIRPIVNVHTATGKQWEALLSSAWSEKPEMRPTAEFFKNAIDDLSQSVSRTFGCS